jgi:N-acetylneuraminic acid mutarotase
MTLLSNGNVLFTEGTAGASWSSILYDSATGTYTATGPVSGGRNGHAATLLSNGKVLITGGYTLDAWLKATYFQSSELYDPATNTFTATGFMIAGRYGHTATLLSNGKVLIAGGVSDAGPLATAELFE